MNSSNYESSETYSINSITGITELRCIKDNYYRSTIGLTKEGTNDWATLTNIRVEPAELGIPELLSDQKRIKFKATTIGNGKLYVTNTNDNKEYSIPVIVLGDFTISGSFENSEYCFVKLYNIDPFDPSIKTFVKEDQVDPFTHDYKFENVNVDKYEIVFEVKSINVRVYKEKGVGGGGKLYSWPIPDGHFCSDMININTNVFTRNLNDWYLGSDEKDARQILQTIEKCYTNFDLFLGNIRVYFSRSITRSEYSFSHKWLNISASSKYKDHDDESVILHEFGHFYMDRRAERPPYTSAPRHYWNVASSEMEAYTEGWASFYSSYIRKNSIYTDINYTGDPDIDNISFNVENLASSVSIPIGNEIEGNVCNVLWDIYDNASANESWDNLNLEETQIIDVFTSSLVNGHTPYTIKEFGEVWASKNYPDISGISGAHGIAISGTVGIEDGLYFVEVPDEVYPNTTFTITTGFRDSNGDGDHIVDGVYTEITAITQDDLRVSLGSNSFTDLPPGYCWKRVGAGKILGEIKAWGTDNDEVLHDAYHPVIITGVSEEDVYTIGGYITDSNGQPVSDVSIEFNDGITISMVKTNASGFYSKSVYCGWTGEVVAYKEGFSLIPNIRDYNLILSNQANQNFTANLLQNLVSGLVKIGDSFLEGVTITYDQGKSVTTDADGSYSFAVDYGWSGNITPIKEGYEFEPGERAVTNVIENMFYFDFQSSLKLVNITGTVTAGGSPLQDVTITYNPGGSVTTDASGNYSFQVNYNWSGTITPSKTNYNFAPPSITLSNVITPQTDKNFTATPQFVNISGTVTAGGSPLQGTTITYTGGTTTTDASGNYSFQVNYNWSGTIAASKTGYTFSPVNISLNNVINNTPNNNFTGTLLTYTVSGKVTFGGTGLNAVTITYTGGTTTTNSTGDYTFTISHGWSGTITPSKANYNFNPPNISLSNVSANTVNQNFTAALLQYTISGKVTENGIGLAGVNINYTGGSTATDSSGSYSFMVNHGWIGTAAPVMGCHIFSPASKNYNTVTANATNQNYTSSMLTYKISGIVTFNSSNPLSGVMVKFYDTEENLVNTITTNSSGYYEATFPCGWSGEIVPVKTDVAFTPTSNSISNLSANTANNNFDGRSQLKISGWIYYEGTSNMVDEAQVDCWGNGFNATTYTDHGYYEIEVPPGWSGYVAAYKAGHRFIPNESYITNISTSTGVSFSAQLVYYTVSGYITDAVGNPVTDVNVNFSNNGGTTLADINGFYQHQILKDWSGSIIPQKNNLEFYPDSISIENLGANIDNKNFAVGYIYEFNNSTLIEPYISYYSENFPYYWGQGVSLSEDHFAMSYGKDISTGEVAIYKFNKTTGAFNKVSTLSGGGLGDATDFYNDLLIIGAPRKIGGSIYRGGGFIYGFENSTWVKKKEFKRTRYQPEGVHLWQFGNDVAIDSDWALISDKEFQRNSPYNSVKGCVVVYKYNYGDWQEFTTLLSSDQNSVAYFGSSIDLSQNKIVVGAPSAESSNNGKAYIYEYNSNTWQNVTILEPTDYYAKKNFGKSLAIENEIIFVGAPYAISDGNQCGGVYVYKKINGEWSNTQILFPSETNNITQFGNAVSASVDYLLVSNYNKIFVFRLINNQWVEYMEFSNYDLSVFGTPIMPISAAIYRDKVVAGIPGYRKLVNNQYYQTGATYVWTNNLSLSKSNIELVQNITENEVPKEYALSQNYPNPFNPSTVIKYQIPENSFVDLKIYDVLGREVSVLANEFKGTGSYEAVFNASNLPSGIYFYKLTTSKYTEIKKMILLK